MGQFYIIAEISSPLAASMRIRDAFQTAAAPAAVLGLSVCMAWRLFRLIDRYSVNVLFLDQWDLYGSFFQNAGIWRLFTQQHGPHRMGVGLLMCRLIAAMTAWDTRAEAFATGGVMCAALLAALALRRRLFGRWAWSDVALPLIFLTPMQWEIYILTSNPSHGAIPLLLLMFYALSWTCPRPAFRYPLILLFTFLATFTGFGMFLGAVSPAMLLLDCCLVMRRRQPGGMALPLITLAGSIVSAAFFFHGYVFNPALSDFRFPDPSWHLYAQCAALALAKALGFPGGGFVSTTVGWSAVLGGAWVIFKRAKLWLDAQAGGRHRDIITAGLVGFSLLFAANLAVGRLCLGVCAGQPSRYLPLLMPFSLGLYFQLLCASPSRLRTMSLWALVALLASAGLPISRDDREGIREGWTGKSAWVEAYRRTEDIAAADRIADFRIYPKPEATGLKAKLDYLKARRLNLYKAPAPAAGANASRSKERK